MSARVLGLRAAAALRRWERLPPCRHVLTPSPFPPATPRLDHHLNRSQWIPNPAISQLQHSHLHSPRRSSSSHSSRHASSHLAQDDRHSPPPSPNSRLSRLSPLLPSLVKHLQPPPSRPQLPPTLVRPLPNLRRNSHFRANPRRRLQLSDPPTRPPLPPPLPPTSCREPRERHLCPPALHRYRTRSRSFRLVVAPARDDGLAGAPPARRARGDRAYRGSRDGELGQEDCRGDHGA